MKLSWSLVASSLSCHALAAMSALSPEFTRLIIAQRLGLARYHTLENAGIVTMNQINFYGGRQPKLFGAEDPDRSHAHLLMWIEDAETGEDTGNGLVYMTDVKKDYNKKFAILNPPSRQDNERLLHDFAQQAESLPGPPDPQQRTYLSQFDIEDVLGAKKMEHYNNYLHIFRADKADGLGEEELAEMVKNVMEKAGKSGFSTTIVMIPTQRRMAKRSTNPWGTYSLPAKDARREEAVLSLNPAPSQSPNDEVPDLESFPVITSQAKDKKAPLGILPSCFETMSACQKQTSNCTSHGECKLLHKARGSESVDCYGCACVPTIKRSEKGMETKRQVTYWGGPACQKEDISVQFWLFAGSGVILAFLVASAIGMLYSMGSEELPSVIGAGVSGPVRK